MEIDAMRTWKALVSGAAIVAAVAGGYLVLRDQAALFGSAAKAAAPPAFAMPVPVTAIVMKTIPLHLEYAARTEAIRDVTLQAKVSGYLQDQTAPDGADVKQGDLLYRIDPRDYQAALDQAKAQLERDGAALDYARASLERGGELTKGGWIAKDTLDQRASTERQAEAALAMDRAAIRTAELNVGYTEIRAAFTGRLGRHQVSVGALVSAAGTALNTLVQLDPLYVTFNPSEAELPQIEKARALGRIGAEVLLPGETQPHYRGMLIFMDNAVERSTGTIVARATIDNPNHTLLPGQYVRVRLTIGEQVDAMLVPQAAIGSSQLGKYVYVVGQGNRAEQRLVSLGPTDGDLVAVKGVAAGDQIISGNLQKIGPGAPVQPLAGGPPRGS
jgi:membrane fusion protein, multidrug efflux system